MNINYIKIKQLYMNKWQEKIFLFSWVLFILFLIFKFTDGMLFILMINISIIISNIIDNL